MPLGTLEVVLVEAKGLKNTDFLSKIDPYVVFTVKTQEKKSNVAKVSEDVSELRLKIMDKDTFTADDFVGEATIPLEPLFAEGSLPPTMYNVVNKDRDYHGEIKIGLTFTPEPERSNFRSRDYAAEENYGGWKESSF
ncbi:unnamed protein product [Prunus armeniaca]|uniref:C2 domain-containing protein n=1 Tax=Prunus armeniaca TaxID=36596 RepID=A0A6J5WJ07_PRUAR|nr:unnamed protein product [Prunus armeniaca]